MFYRRTALTLFIVLTLGGTAHRVGAEELPFTAGQGLDLAFSAAQAWAADAKLVYLENDEDLDGGGSSSRWGYLFHSQSKEGSRAYSLDHKGIRQARDLEFDFPAPPLADGWLDSSRALALAEEKAGRDYRAEHAGRLSTMLLSRGLFHQANPDLSTWTIVFSSASAPSLFILLDAEKGRVVRTWEG